MPGPFLGTILASRIAAEGGAPELATDRSPATCRSALAEHEGDGFRVFDHAATTVRAAARRRRRRVLALEGVTLTDEPSFDMLGSAGTTDVRVVGGRLATAPDAAGIFDRALVLLAAELAGIAAATTAQSVAYAKDREQFGQPIGGFQAVKHRCADMAVRAEASTSAGPLRGTRRRATARPTPPSTSRRPRSSRSRPRHRERRRSTCRTTAASGSPGSTRLTAT